MKKSIHKYSLALYAYRPILAATLNGRFTYLAADRKMASSHS